MVCSVQWQPVLLMVSRVWELGVRNRHSCEGSIRRARLLPIAVLDPLEVLLLPALVTSLDTGRKDKGSRGNGAALGVLGIGDVLTAGDVVNNLHAIRGRFRAADTGILSELELSVQREFAGLSSD